MPKNTVHRVGGGRTRVLLLIVVLLCLGGVRGWTQIQQPPPAGGGVDYGIVCDGTTVTSTAIQNALNTAPVGAKIVLPPGVCLLNQTLTITTNTLTLEGAGILHTILRQTVQNIPVISIGAVNDVHLKEFTVEHTGSPVLGGDGIVVDNVVNHAYLEYLAANWNWRGFVLGCVAFGSVSEAQASNNNNNGFEFVYSDATCGAAQWQVHHTLSQLNKGVGYGGFNTSASNAIGPFMNDAGSFGNDFGGYVFIGASGHPINDLFLVNVFSSADNRAGIYLDTYGTSHLVSNPWIELTGLADGFPLGAPPYTTAVASHTGHCLGATVNNLPGLTITGGHYWNCSWSGVALDAPLSSLTGGASVGAGLALDPDLSRRANVHIGANGVGVSGHTFNYAATGVLHYIHLGGTLTQLAIGQNTYAPGIDATQTVSSSDATFSGTSPPTMAAGLAVHSNRPGTAGLFIYDATGGPDPIKVLRVSNGQLQVINADATAVIQGLSNQGTPSWPNRRGQAVVVDGNVSANVGLNPNEPDPNYFVQLTVSGSTNGAAPGALVVGGVNKSTFGFEILVTGAPGIGKSVVYNWLVYR